MTKEPKLKSPLQHIILCAIIAAVGSIWAWRNAAQAKKTSETKFLINAIYLGLPALSTNELASIARAGKTSRLALNEELAAAFERYDYHVARRTSPNERFRLADEWGSPLVILQPAAAESLPLADGLRGTNRLFVIWSCGPNRMDDHGKGDDVFLP